MTELHPRLAADTVALAETPLCRLRWMNDRRFPWVLLIPKKDEWLAWHHLPENEQLQLLRDMNAVAGALETAASPDRINIGALGNLVPQLHVHVIARYKQDACWPGPVWGRGEAEPYEPGEQPLWLPAFRASLPDHLVAEGQNA